LINGYRLGENPLVTDFLSVVQAERLKVFKAKQPCQSCVISHLWVLIQGQMHRIQADIVIKQEFYPPP
jgi:hypothetical protein